MTARRRARKEGAPAAAREAEGGGAKRAPAPAGRRPARARSAGPDEPRVPRWLPAALYGGLTLVLFREFVFSDRMLFGSDTLSLGYVARALYAQALDGGFFPRWEPHLLGGVPFLEALSGGDALYPPSLLLLVLLEPYRALGWKLVLHVAAAGFFMFGWVRTLRGSRAAALLAGAAYMLAPYFVSLVHPGHDGKIFVTALTPLLFLTVERWFERPQLTRFTAVALTVALVILTTHFQMAYFLFGAAGLYAIFRAVALWRAGEGAAAAGAAGSAEDRAAATSAAGGAEEAPPVRRPVARAASLRFALFLAAAVTGLGIAAVQFVPAVAYATQYSRRIQTTREAAGETGVAWSSSWSLHPEEAMAMLIPEFAGNDAGGADWSQGTYWGRNALKDNHEGTGVVVLLLAAVALLAAKGDRGRRAFFAALAGVAFLFALGAHTPVWRIFYEVVPGIRMFRAPSQAMFLFAFSASTLAALGMDALLARRREGAPTRTGDLRALGIGAGVLVLLALLAASGTLTSMWTATVYADAAPERLERLSTLEPFIARGAWVSALLALATAGLAWAHRAAWLPSGVLVGCLVALVVTDELRVSSGFVEVIDFEDWAAPDPNVQAVLEREQGSDEPYRLLSFRQLGQDVKPALQGIELAGGHHPNDLSRYRELIGMVGSGLPENLLDPDIRRLLNVRYVLWPDWQFGAAPGGQVLSRTALRDGRPYETMLVEPGLPRARLVGAATVRSDEEAVAYMLSDAFDPEREVVLAEPPPIELDGAPASGSVTWQERTPNRLVLSVSTERPALLVVADNWFPAWHATVDGTEAPVLRAYHTLRAVPVPAGEHTVEMVYRSGVVRASLGLSLGLLALLGAATGTALWRQRRVARGEP